MSRLRATPLALAFALLVMPAGARAADDSKLEKAGAGLQAIGAELQKVEARLQLVEKQYLEFREPGEEEALRRRYSEAEIQFLLKNYPNASVLLYDLMGTPAFRSMPEHVGALYLLGESLYQQRNYLGARPYYREHMKARGEHSRGALARYLEISGRLHAFAGVDGLVAEARGADGRLPSDIAYAYGKWLFRRTDVPERERIARAREVFSRVAGAGEAFVPQARYFLAVLAVQEGDLAAAEKHFQSVLAAPPANDAERKVHEQATLGLGRIYFEQARYEEAIARYGTIDLRSENLVEALYETAWAHVRLAKTKGPGEYEKANRACEKLLVAAGDSVVVPEALILQGHLLLKLARYEEATEAYTGVINTYLEVYDNLDGRLKAHPDPVRYFQETISSSGKTFDIAALLPPLALRWATAHREVAEAVQVTADIDESRKGVSESQEIAARLLEVLERRKLEVFPQYQEGYGRAEAVDSALADLDGKLLALEESLTEAGRDPAVLSRVAAARAERQELARRFANLPKTDEELAARKAKMSAEVGGLEQGTHQLSYQAEGLFAILTALEKFVADTRDQRPDDAEGEREFADRMRQEREVAGQLRAEVESLQRQMRDERAKLGLAGSGDAELRARYELLMRQEAEALRPARDGADPRARTLLAEVDALRARIDPLQERTATARRRILEVVAAKAEAIRAKVQLESDRLRDYEKETARAVASAQNLVGSIAYESFRRVRTQFYELVLKADIGLVDVAWTRKQEKTRQIQDLARRKDDEMKALDDEFKEALGGVD